ncbi:MAG: sn-glycerol-3-phosphate transporter [Burkholderiales bacterium]|nr:MAG: sn-glycerol-3-phosphate transporter [Betaproteobacteria bacterium]TAG23919.1 MAG: sn-glycerol-3-phosphate transporter [Burkholderiales bacterium]
MKCLKFIAACLGALLASVAIAQSAPAMGVAAAAGNSSSDTWLRDGDRVFFQYSVYNKHWTKNPEHVNRNHLLNFQIQSNYDRVWGADKTLFGLAFFKNSFGQPSQFLYWGQQWDFNDYFYAKVSAGLLHGYKGKYKDKIPFNKLGVAPAILPTLGMRYKNASVEAIILGNSALMIGVGYTF